MGTLSFSQALALFLAVVEIAVLALASVRRVWKTLPYLFIYLALVVAIEGARWFVLVKSGTGSRSYSWTYWLTQPALLAARAAVLADVCRASLSFYRGVWQMTRYLLGGTAAILVVLAFARTVEKPGFVSYLLFAERELEVSVVVILLLLLVVSRYYGVELGQPLKGIILGLVFYSSVVVINTSILIGPLALSWPVFSTVRVLAYLAALGMWGQALWVPFSQPERPPLIPSAEFEIASGAVDQRMRELNARILQLMKR